jgi:hypothetical protein
MLGAGNTKTPIEVLRDIIVHELGLDDDRAALYNQKWNIPEDDDLFIFVEYRYGNPLGNNMKYAAENETFQTEARIVMAEHVTIGLYSRNLDALKRKEEALAAINSHYARQMMEKYSFRVMGRNAPIKDLSYVEGAARIFRFDIDLILLSKYKIVTDVDYFDEFPTEVNFEKALLQKTFNEQYTP